MYYYVALMMMMMMMDGSAAVVWGPEQPFVLEEVRVQPPQKMEVRMKIHFTSICHTDLSAWKGEVSIYLICSRESKFDLYILF